MQNILILLMKLKSDIVTRSLDIAIGNHKPEKVSFIYAIYLRKVRCIQLAVLVASLPTDTMLV